MANRMISYGYGIKDGTFSVMDAEAAIVKRIFAEYIDGKLLQDIADELTREQVEFYMGNCVWNKNRIARIIDNEKYIGADGYPQIIDDDDFVYARQLKEEKGAKKIHFDETIEYLRNNKITCSQCGAPMKRISKWRSREKWMCRQGCKNEIYIADNIIFGGINAILYQITQNPDCVRPIDEEKKPNLEIRRRMSEINRLLSSSNPTFTVGKKIRKLSQQLVALRQQRDLEKKKMEAMPKAKSEIERMKKMFEEKENFITYRDEVVRCVVECIRVADKETISIILKGGYTVDVKLDEK